jgi:hypothetical protein
VAPPAQANWNPGATLDREDLADLFGQPRSGFGLEIRNAK